MNNVLKMRSPVKYDSGFIDGFKLLWNFFVICMIPKAILEYFWQGTPVDKYLDSLLLTPVLIVDSVTMIYLVYISWWHLNEFGLLDEYTLMLFSIFYLMTEHLIALYFDNTIPCSRNVSLYLYVRIFLDLSMVRATEL